MAEITSSSVTSSMVPAKEVSRRSIRIALSLSALPRRALISCRRSESFRGRKSMIGSPHDTGDCGPAAGRNGLASGPGGQLREQEVDAPVQQLVVVIDLEHLTAPFEVVTHSLSSHQ